MKDQICTRKVSGHWVRGPLTVEGFDGGSEVDVSYNAVFKWSIEMEQSISVMCHGYKVMETSHNFYE